MESTKGGENQDPDYLISYNADINRQNIYENNARTTTSNKISKIIEAEFTKEISNKKSEIFKIYKTLNKACKIFHYLRFAIVTDFYNQEHLRIDEGSKQSRLHPTVFSSVKKDCIIDVNKTNDHTKELTADKLKRKIDHESNETKRRCLQSDFSEKVIVGQSLLSTKSKTKKRIIIGNISKWIPPEYRDHKATHKWTVYIRDSEKSDLGKIISKVRFFLHPSYKPNDVVELISAPFHLSRHGWGEFPVRVQLHFKNSFNKPIDIIHHLKLDRTFTGLQTIGSETVVDIWLNINEESITSNIKETNDKKIYSIPAQKFNLSGICHFLNDHDYTGENLRFVGQTICHLNESESLDKSDFHLQQNNDQSEIKNIDERRIENSRILTDINKKQESDQNKIPSDAEHENFKNTLLNSKTKSEYISNEISLLKSNNINDKKIFSKRDNRLSSEENSKLLINLVNNAKLKDLYSILKFITRRMPLITEKAVDYNYKLLHPYVSESLQIFNNYSKAKQSSLERYRAISVLDILRKTNCFDNNCNTKEFIIWARRYCYTPVLNFKNIRKLNTSIDAIDVKDEKKQFENTSTISFELTKWLSECQKISPSMASLNNDIDNEQIDILSTPLITSNSLSMYDNLKKNNSPMIHLKYPETQNILNEFVCKSAEKIGIKLTNEEEIIPNVLHNTASVIMTSAVECLIDELLRIAFTSALDKSSTEGNIISIEVDDVRMALLKKEEFNIFTNAGLGSEG